MHSSGGSTSRAKLVLAIALVGVAAIFSVIFFTMIVWLLFIAAVSVTLFLASRPEAAAQREPSTATL